MEFKRGDKVDADPGGGYKIGFVASGPTGPEDKYAIQIGGDVVNGFAYRETDDVKASGGDSGLTFKKL